MEASHSNSSGTYKMLVPPGISTPKVFAVTTSIVNVADFVFDLVVRIVKIFVSLLDPFTLS